MSLKSIFKKASMTLGSILLACNIGCSNHFQTSDSQDKYRRVASTNLEERVSLPHKPKKWQYPLNVAGGYLMLNFAHESSHALTGLGCGADIEDYHPYPGFRFGRYWGGWAIFEQESLDNLTAKERALIAVAGPASNVLLSEIINYNLRNGKIPKKYQSFWATTSLISRLSLIANGWDGFTKGNDFWQLKKEADIDQKHAFLLIGVYTVLSARRIEKELKVAFGRDSYDYTPKRKGELSLLPIPNGLGLTYSTGF